MIRAVQEQGGFFTFIGPVADRQERLMYPIVTFVCCDNKEAVSLASIKSGRTARPSRHCLCSLADMNEFNMVRESDMRDGKAAHRAIQNNDKVYLKQNSLHGDVQVNKINSNALL